MLLHIKRALALAVCLSTLGTAGAPAAPQAQGRGQFSGVRAVWMLHSRTRAFGLLSGACLCLVILELKVLRRKHSGHERLASALASALRGRALDFGAGARIEGPLWSYTMEADEAEERNETPALQAQMNVGRYELLAYDAGAGHDDLLKDTVVTISYLGGRLDSEATIRDEDLLLGVPREFLKPIMVEEVEPAQAMLALTAGSADGDDPGEGIAEPDLP